MKMLNNKMLLLYLSAGFVLTGLLVGCGSATDSTTVEGNVSIAYVKRPNSTLGNPTDSVVTGTGGDLYIRDRSSPNGQDQNVTATYTGGQGDVSDLEVSYDGTKLLFTMRCPTASTATLANGQPACTGRWSIYQYDVGNRGMSRIDCSAPRLGDDVDPAYLPDGRIVFVSNRQAGRAQMSAFDNSGNRSTYTYLDEYERERVTTLHVMDADGGNCRQISYNQSHDRNPTVLMDGRIMYSRWDHVGGRNQFSIFKVNPDGTDLFVMYGAHSPGNSYLHPREMPDGRIISSLMPLSRTREGGSLEIIDANNYSDNDAAGTNAPPNQMGEQAGQFQATRLVLGGDAATHEAMRGQGISPYGRYSTPYPLWDGTGRVLVVWSPSQPQPGTDAAGQPITVEGTPRYGIWMFDVNKRQTSLVAPPQDGFYYADPVAIQARPVPQRKAADYVRDSTITPGMGRLNVNTVYDTDRLQRMGDAVLVNGESIPRTGGTPNIGAMKTPGTTEYANRVARFFRITKAVPTPGGMQREALGETEFEMQQIVGYGVIEPDGSLRGDVPASTPIHITALDQYGRAFTPHTNWIQALDQERRFCKGCHSSRLTTTSGTDLMNTPSPTGPIGLHPDPSNPASDLTGTMAEARTGAQPSVLTLQRNISYTDVWTPLYNTRYGWSITAQAAINIDYAGLTTTAPYAKGPASCATTWSGDCSIVINFPEHVQPILSAKCESCHATTAAAVGLDFSSTPAGIFGRTMAYQELLVGDPRIDATTGQPVTRINNDGELEVERESAPVSGGSSRASRLVERIFEQPLRAGVSSDTLRSFCKQTASGVQCFGGAVWQDHSGYLNASERRVITEWIDLGAQYLNDAYDGSGALRTVSARLSDTVFACQIAPILRDRGTSSCASCHQAVGSTGSSNPTFAASRYVLTGADEGDFNATASMVTFPPTGDSYLVARPLTAPHPMDAAGQPFLSAADATTMRTWIAGTLTCP
jgi:hypothetical protein